MAKLTTEVQHTAAQKLSMSNHRKIYARVKQKYGSDQATKIPRMTSIFCQNSRGFWKDVDRTAKLIFKTGNKQKRYGGDPRNDKTSHY